MLKNLFRKTVDTVRGNGTSTHIPMEIIDLEGTEDTPRIILDSANGIFEISGRSLPEDTTEFYRPVLAWIEKYAHHANPHTHFAFKLEYFNTASSKVILDILHLLEGLENVEIHWYYSEDDEDMEEAGQEFSELVNIPFQFKSC